MNRINVLFGQFLIGSAVSMLIAMITAKSLGVERMTLGTVLGIGILSGLSSLAVTIAFDLTSRGRK